VIVDPGRSRKLHRQQRLLEARQRPLSPPRSPQEPPPALGSGDLHRGGWPLRVAAAGPEDPPAVPRSPPPAPPESRANRAGRHCAGRRPFFGAGSTQTAAAGSAAQGRPASRRAVLLDWLGRGSPEKGVGSLPMPPTANGAAKPPDDPARLSDRGPCPGGKPGPAQPGRAPLTTGFPRLEAHHAAGLTRPASNRADHHPQGRCASDLVIPHTPPVDPGFSLNSNAVGRPGIFGLQINGCANALLIAPLPVRQGAHNTACQADRIAPRWLIRTRVQTRARSTLTCSHGTLSLSSSWRAWAGAARSLAGRVSGEHDGLAAAQRGFDHLRVQPGTGHTDARLAIPYRRHGSPQVSQRRSRSQKARPPQDCCTCQSLHRPTPKAR